MVESNQHIKFVFADVNGNLYQIHYFYMKISYVHDSGV